MEDKQIRVLIAKPGLDGHNRGAKVLTIALRQEGFNVIYSGLRQDQEQIVEKAIEKNVDVIGLSLLSGAHKELFPRVVEIARQRGLNKVLIIGGGVIPEEDIPFLRERGIAVIFGPGSSIKVIADYIRQNVYN
jgi:methylmalonyl-CoA mutase C-terminal domain/subunit